jgi:hypothetical protein
MLRAHQQERVPAAPPVEISGNATTVLAGKGSLRRAKQQRALACCAPLWPGYLCDGRLRREHFAGAWAEKGKAGSPPAEESRPDFQNLPVSGTQRY